MDEKKTKLITQTKGYTHTGAFIGVNYQIPQTDPNFKRPVYGKSKPQSINLSNNLLSRF